MDSIRHIEISQELPGFERFMGAWAVLGEQNVLFDVGPASSAEVLLDGLEKEGVDRLDWVILSHIHIDHCGALGRVLKRYPEAKAVCHADGVRFMENPAKLWEGSLKVLGKTAEAYGPPESVAADRLASHNDVRIKGLDIYETPGHAPHHLSFTYGGRLFAGEAGGNFFIVNGREYLRPATPPRFFLKVALGSVDLLLSLPDQPIHYAHFEAAPGSHAILKRFRAQLIRWAEIIAGETAHGGAENLEKRCIDALLALDPELAAFRAMDSSMQKRERTFMGNSVRGYIGFITQNG